MCSISAAIWVITKNGGAAGKLSVVDGVVRTERRSPLQMKKEVAFSGGCNHADRSSLPSSQGPLTKSRVGD